MNVILTGMRGTGKSSIGTLLADRLAYTFVDTDTAIEALAGGPIAAIVARHGWDHFRALERQIVAQIATADNQVIAAGGGTLIDQANAAHLKARGIVVLLLCDIELLQHRLSQGSNRPPLTAQGSAIDELAHIWQARQTHYYTTADLVYDVSTQSEDLTADLYEKAKALHHLLEQHGRFRAGAARQTP